MSGRILLGARSLLTGLRELVVVYLPGPLGAHLRQRHYRGRLRHLGRDVQIEVGVQLVNPEWISIGDDCWIDRYAVLLGGPPREGGRKLARRPNADFHHTEGELVIGKQVHIAPHAVVSGHGGVHIEGVTTVAAGAKVYSLTHHHRNLEDEADTTRYRFTSQAPDEQQALISAPVVIGEGAAVGLNAVVLPGVTIGRDAWVGAGAVVTDSVEPGRLAWGTPARDQGER